MEVPDDEAVGAYLFDNLQVIASKTSTLEVIVFPDGKSFAGFRATVDEIRVDENKSVVMIVRDCSQRLWAANLSMLGIPVKHH